MHRLLLVSIAAFAIVLLAVSGCDYCGVGAACGPIDIPQPNCANSTFVLNGGLGVVQALEMDCTIGDAGPSTLDLIPGERPGSSSYAGAAIGSPDCPTCPNTPTAGWMWATAATMPTESFNKQEMQPAICTFKVTCNDGPTEVTVAWTIDPAGSSLSPPCTAASIRTATVCNVCPGTMCGSRCVDSTTDNNNCGSCGNVCPTGATCDSGVCDCPAPFTLCGTACVNLQFDQANCGACGNVCSASDLCLSADCIPASDAGIGDASDAG